MRDITVSEVMDAVDDAIGLITIFGKLDNVAATIATEAIEAVIGLIAKLQALAKAAGATDAEMDAMAVRLEAAHQRRQAEGNNAVGDA
jgi:hypothetical protein